LSPAMAVGAAALGRIALAATWSSAAGVVTVALLGPTDRSHR
jgi:hypothetical protein